MQRERTGKMPTVGIRELKSQASEIVRHVREEQVEYVVTMRGEPVALLLPIDRESLETQAVELAKRTTGSVITPDREELKRRAIALAGQFHSEERDLSIEHDRYLAEAYEE